MSCSRRSAAVILLRGADLREVLTVPSCQRGQQLQRQQVTGRRGGASTSDGSAGGGWVSGGVVGLELRVESLGHRPAHVLDPAQLLEDPDQTGGGVELAAEYAVARAGRVGGGQVGPGLAGGRDRQPPRVGGLVARGARAFAGRF